MYPRNFDWSLRINASAETIISKEEQIIIQATKVEEPAISGGKGHFVFPRIRSAKVTSPKVVEETRLRKTIAIPFDNEPYVAKVSVTQSWKGADTSGQPDIYWGLEMHGVHWDEAINCKSKDRRGKDWVPELLYVWPGENMPLKDRLLAFLQCIMKVHNALDTLDLGTDEEVLREAERYKTTRAGAMKPLSEGLGGLLISFD